MIGLAKLPSGAYSLTLAGAPLFLVVRRHRIVYAECWIPTGSMVRWSAGGPTSRAEAIATGLLTLAEQVVMPAG